MFAEYEVKVLGPRVDEAGQLRVDEHVVAIADLHAHRFAAAGRLAPGCKLLVCAVQDRQIVRVVILEYRRHDDVLWEISEQRYGFCVDVGQYTVWGMFAREAMRCRHDV